MQGHHWHVATPADPASARLGEPFPRFWVRSVVGSFLSALRIDRRRVLSYVAAELAMGCVIGAACGAAGAAFFAAQGVVGFTLLEAGNYLEHYGLQRKQLPDGTYEPVTPLHSWNADNTVSDAASSGWAATPTTTPSRRGGTRSCGRSRRARTCRRGTPASSRSCSRRRSGSR